MKFSTNSKVPVLESVTRDDKATIKRIEKAVRSAGVVLPNIKTANQIDSQKIEAKIVEILTASSNDKIVVNFKKFYTACHLQALRSIQFVDEVCDILTGAKFVEQHGIWVFVSGYDGGYSLFMRVAAPHRRASVEALLRCGILTEHMFESAVRDDSPINEIE